MIQKIAREADRLIAKPDVVGRLNERFADASAEEILNFTLTGVETGRVAAVSSFGTESAVLLHLLSRIDANTPVLFIDTGKHFPQTIEYRHLLSEQLKLTDVRDIRPDVGRIASKDAKGMRWSYDPDFCCQIRKVEPLEQALANFDTSITGRKAYQAQTRAALAYFEIDGERLKVNPLAGWNKAKIDAYFDEFELPRHPLEHEGYLSVGCAPCTSKVLPGEGARAGRWRNFDKIECGIHGLAHSVGRGRGDD